MFQIYLQEIHTISAMCVFKLIYPVNFKIKYSNRLCKVACNEFIKDAILIEIFFVILFII